MLHLDIKNSSLNIKNIAQNIYLIGNALGLGICSVGGFLDDGLNDILDIDGRIESVIGVIAVGNKEQKGI